MGSNATHVGRFWVWERQGLEQVRAFSVLGSEIKAQQVWRRAGEETFPVAWRPFHVLTPILQALGWGTLRGVLPSRGIPRGCVAQHTIHEEEEEIGREGNARRTTVDGKGILEEGEMIEIK